MIQLGNYKLVTEWQNSPNGKNAIGIRDKEEYFIKQFLKPVYPKIGTCSPPVLKRRKKECNDFENHQRKLLRELKNLAGTGGNLVVAVEFFRLEERYYKVTKKIDAKFLTTEDISKLNYEKKLLLIKTISQSLKTLHRAKIVHGDLKPDNILISRSETGNLVTKIIDFDDSYFETKPPASEDTIGTVNYYSPELAKHVIYEDQEKLAKQVTCMSDVFALGLIFHEYFAGELPKVFGNEDAYRYIYEAVLDDKKIIINPKIPEKEGKLIKQMLHKDFIKRPSISKVFEILKVVEKNESDICLEFIKKSTFEKYESHTKNPIIKKNIIATKRPVSLYRKAIVKNPNIKVSAKPIKVIKRNNNQYTIYFTDGSFRTVPSHYVKSRGYENLILL